MLLLYTSTQHVGTSLHVASLARPPPRNSTASDKHRGEKDGYEAGLTLPKRVDWVQLESKNLVLWVVWIMTIQGVRVRSRLKITPKEAGVVIIVVSISSPNDDQGLVLGQRLVLHSR